jgi:hypothetical protein
MYVFGVDIGIMELLTGFVLVLVGYLIILEFEFRHVRTLTRRFDEEEIQLGRAMRELKDEVTALKDVLATKKMSK